MSRPSRYNKMTNEDHKAIANMAFNIGMSHTAISLALGIPRKTISDFLSRRLKTHKEFWNAWDKTQDILDGACSILSDMYVEEKDLIADTEGMEVVGIIGDTHEPYTLDGYLEFCVETFKKAGVTKVVHIGDLIDHHALSFHESEPTLASGYDEYILAKDALQKWYKAFPELTLLEGNHDLIPARQLKRVGLDPMTWMRSLKEVYEMPEGWTVVQDIIIDGVYYHHGYSAVGVNGFRNDAAKRMMSSVSGHAHSNAGISATASNHRLVWGMAVGCGVDNTQMAFAYGKQFLNKPIISCGVVAYGQPRIHYMSLGEKY